MSKNDVVGFLKDYYASWGTGEVDRILTSFSDDSVFEDLAFEARFEGLAEIQSFAELTYAGAPDFAVHPSNIISGEGGAAAAEWTMTGTHKGDLPGLPATGRRFEVRACSAVRVSDGVITSIQDYWSVDTFRRSVGLL